jgi:hypothetical protein
MADHDHGQTDHYRCVAKAAHDPCFWQSRFDRTADVPRFSGGFPLCAGASESVALAMADGFAQATRNAALVNLHSSAGTGHALGNLFTA